MAEYEKALESIATEIEPVKREIDEIRGAVDAEARALEATVQELEDNIAEARFRQRVGEFDEATLQGVVARLEPQLTQNRTRRDQLTTLRDSLDRRRPAAAPADPEPATPPTPASPPDDELFELKESSVVSQGIRPAPTNRNDGNGDEDDPLRALSDPSPTAEKSQPAAAPATPQPARSGPARGTAVAPSYPSLLIRSGVHQGKIVPLLPITMSIGREHDNNIELKDEDVSRYHARILYEEGRFFVEDLESSSGTWVNGVRQRRSALGDGDVIRIGTTELAFDVS
jgi:pSer/pThr/pTyr-binding forkhead associated (FHA) protein